jgi:hypothetical protein
MDDEALDRLLTGSAPAPSAPAVETALLLSRQVADAHRKPPPWWKRRPVLAAAVGAGAVLLVGAGTVKAYQLGIPPFQTLDPGTVRAAPVEIDYTNSLGKQVRCQAFSEWEHLTDDQRTVLSRAAKDGYWTGYGGRVLAARGLQGASVEDQEQAVFDQAASDVRERAEAALARTTGLPLAVYHGFSVTCAPGGADGQ